MRDIKLTKVTVTADKVTVQYDSDHAKGNKLVIPAFPSYQFRKSWTKIFAIIRCVDDSFYMFNSLELLKKEENEFAKITAKYTSKVGDAESKFAFVYSHGQGSLHEPSKLMTTFKSAVEDLVNAFEDSFSLIMSGDAQMAEQWNIEQMLEDILEETRRDVGMAPQEEYYDS